MLDKKGGIMDKDKIRDWPAVRELVGEARIADAQRNYLANDDNIEFCVVNILARLYVKCFADDSMHRELRIREIDIMADAQLWRYWSKMLKQVKGNHG